MIITKQVSSLEKVMPKATCDLPETKGLKVLHGEEANYQIAFTMVDIPWDDRVCFKLESDIDEHISVYVERIVPCTSPHYPSANDDDNYLTHDATLIPDALEPYKGEVIRIFGTYKAMWIHISKDAPIGKHKIVTSIYKEDECVTNEFELEVLPVDLPKQELIVTEWFHGDCIANYYGVNVFSELHWALLEKFIKLAVDTGINMLLTPLFTPPLDTEVGGERTTIQLLGIKKDGDKYTFDFSKVKRWIDMCHRCGIKYFEISHLFTQWGAKYTPKIYATVNSVETRIFDWHVKATAPEYADFLSQMLPALTDFLRSEGVLDNCFFHISDEPQKEMLDDYNAAKALTMPYLKDCKFMDALSNYEFYEQGLIEYPVSATNHIEDFIGKVEHLWPYYCCGQNVGLSNRLISMPSYRNRSIGYQMYKYNAFGFLQWGYNFYYSQHSKQQINPFYVTDAFGFPSGDAFSVYPGEDGPEPSLRILVFKEALQDISALKALEAKIGHDEVVGIIEKHLGKVKFDRCATSAEQILNMREEINTLLCK